MLATLPRRTAQYSSSVRSWVRYSLKHGFGGPSGRHVSLSPLHRQGSTMGSATVRTRVRYSASAKASLAAFITLVAGRARRREARVADSRSPQWDAQHLMCRGGERGGGWNHRLPAPSNNDPTQIGGDLCSSSYDDGIMVVGWIIVPGGTPIILWIPPCCCLAQRHKTDRPHHGTRLCFPMSKPGRRSSHPHTRRCSRVPKELHSPALIRWWVVSPLVPTIALSHCIRTVVHLLRNTRQNSRMAWSF